MAFSIIEQNLQNSFLKYLKEKYLIELKNTFQVPKIKKIIVHRSLVKHYSDKVKFLTSINELKLITGQLPTLTLSKKSSNKFKQKIGTPVGLKVTLRKNKMYYFLEKLILFVLPRELHFQGCSKKSFDKQGNFNLGIKTQSSFIELDSYLISFKNGYNINIVFDTCKINKDYNFNQLLLEFLGLPF
nr:ribosomal protein L5 [Coccidia sp. AB-2023a]